MALKRIMTHIEQLLQRPIAFQRIFVDITGSIEAALFLSQLLYWNNKGKDPDGWIYKTQQEWEEETALKRKPQERARKVLVEKGILEEKRAGQPARLFYRLNLFCLNEALKAFCQNVQPSMSQSDNLESNCRTNYIDTEITTEITTHKEGVREKKPFGFQVPTASDETNSFPIKTSSDFQERKIPPKERSFQPHPYSALATDEAEAALKAEGKPYVDDSWAYEKADKDAKKRIEECKQTDCVSDDSRGQEDTESPPRYIHPIQKVEARFKREFHPWRNSDKRNDYNIGFVAWLKDKHLSLTPYWQNRSNAPSIWDAKNWIVKKEYTEDGLAEIENKWLEYQESQSKQVVNTENATNASGLTANQKEFQRLRQLREEARRQKP